MSPRERIDALVEGAPPEADEQRLARLIYELQAVRPTAPEAVRARVDALAAAEPARRRVLLERLSLRRALLVLAPAVVVVAVGAAAVQGIVSATSDDDRGIPFMDPADMRAVSRAPSEDATRAPRAPEAAAGRLDQSLTTANVPTAPGRAQDYHASLRLRVDDVDDLSAKTQRALRLTRDYGGYVVSTRFRNPRTSEGDAFLDLRVPIGRVQQALVAFSELGSIASQDVSIRDLQGDINRSTREIRKLRERIASLQAELLNPDLTTRERARLVAELAQARARVTALEDERRALQRQGRFAKISLALTTRKPVVQKDEAGRIERAFDDAGSVLAKELAFGLYALMVAAPFFVLAALALAGTRAGRRRADQRLLERA